MLKLSKQYIPLNEKQDKIKTDIIGVRFGRLIVQSYSHSEKRTKSNGSKHYYNCLCDCSNTCIKERCSLKCGNTSSCGCIRSEMLTKRNKETGSLHGDSVKYERLHNSWSAMLNRCDHTNNKNYDLYGGRGIKVCDEWHKWEVFRDWALDNGYNDGLTIDRIDRNGNYEPSNCRWVTMDVQANNKSNNKYITYQGRTQSLADWCRELDIDYFRTKARLNSCGMTPEQAFEMPKYYTQKECGNSVSKRNEAI